MSRWDGCGTVRVSTRVKSVGTPVGPLRRDGEGRQDRRHPTTEIRALLPTPLPEYPRHPFTGGPWRRLGRTTSLHVPGSRQRPRRPRSVPYPPRNTSGLSVHVDRHPSRRRLRTTTVPRVLLHHRFPCPGGSDHGRRRECVPGGKGSGPGSRRQDYRGVPRKNTGGTGVCIGSPSPSSRRRPPTPRTTSPVRSTVLGPVEVSLFGGPGFTPDLSFLPRPSNSSRHRRTPTLPRLSRRLPPTPDTDSFRYLPSTLLGDMDACGDDSRRPFGRHVDPEVDPLYPGQTGPARRSTTLGSDLASVLVLGISILDSRGSRLRPLSTDRKGRHLPDDEGTTDGTGPGSQDGGGRRH